MLQAELHGKLPEIERMEDVLTSNIFGMIKYMPPSVGIFNILSCAKDYSKDRKPLIDNLKNQNLNFQDYDHVDFLFWENSSEHGEPDIILIMKSSKQTLDDLMLCIEVKYFSPKSRFGDQDQLMDYFLSLNNPNARRTYKNKKISRFEGKFVGLIYLTHFSQYTSVRDSLKEIYKKESINYEHKLFELRWHDIARILTTLKCKTKYEEDIVKDLVLLLQKKNLLDFSGFSAPSFELKYEPFLSVSSNLVKSSFSGFSILDSPDILNYEKNIFLEG